MGWGSVGKSVAHEQPGAVHSPDVYMTETDGSLAARAASDPAALTELYRRYLPEWMATVA